jgi:putative FmdB family regulatory protein
MPTYEYECPDCGHHFERFQSITAAPARVCPACRRRRVKRLIGTGGGIIFRGSGFYATDYRSEAYTKQAKAEKETGAGKTPETPASADKGRGGAKDAAE